MSIHKIIFVVITTSIVNGIQPTSINGTTEIYHTSSANQFLSATITCGTEICHVICDKSYGCDSAQINAAASDELILDCLASYSCDSLTVSTPPKVVANIQCQNTRACYYADLNVSTTPTVNFNCSIDSPDTSSSPCHATLLHAEYATTVNANCIDDYSCYGTRFYVNNVDEVTINFNYYSGHSAHIYGENIQNGLTTYCNDINSCLYTQVYCPLKSSCNIYCGGNLASIPTCSGLELHVENKNYYNYLNIFCNTNNTQSCHGTTFTCQDTGLQSRLLYDFDKSQFKCTAQDSGNWDCCPWIEGTHTCSNIDGGTCIIDCDSNIDCVNWLIDGANADKLIVNCSYPNSFIGACRSTRIKCPSRNNSSCVIDCNSNNACAESTISTYNVHMNEFSSTCSSDGCMLADMLFNFKTIDILNLFFFGYDGPLSPGQSVNAILFDNGENMSLVNTLNIDCIDGDSCVGLSVTVAVIDYAYITCEGINACKGAYFNMLNGGESKINVTCVADMSCYEMELFATDSDVLGLSCYNGGGDNACSFVNVYCPYQIDGICKIECLHWDNTCNDMNVYINDTDSDSNLDLKCIYYPNPYGYAGDYHNINPCKSLDFHCINDDKLSTTLIYDNITRLYECEHANISYCCPFSDGMETTQKISSTLSTQSSASSTTSVSVTETMVSIDQSYSSMLCSFCAFVSCIILCVFV
eukprot:466569_1